MASKGWVKGKVIDLNQKNNMDAWRQRLLVSIYTQNLILQYLTFMSQTEEKSQRSITQKEIERLEALLEQKNSYFELYKTDMAKTKKAEEEAKKESETFGYDKVFAMYDEKIAGSTKYEDRKVQKKPKLAGTGKAELQ